MRSPVVLAIEDEAQLRRALRVVFPAQGYRFLDAETAASGIELAAIHKPDIVVLDLGLPRPRWRRR
jgi:two-component system KDP operon response regulator KdpE